MIASVTLLLATLVPSLVNTIQTVDIESRQSFEIDYEHDTFLKDGKPFRYVSGSLHYFRVPRQYWRDRLRKYRAAGLNAVSTYIEWSIHEPQPGQYDFYGQNDLEYFIILAQEEGLLVILRPGPYICAERDFGGYPPWLLNKNQTMRLRTSDPSHTKYVKIWLKRLFPVLQPWLYGNGGPIIMVQIENEYGSYQACDRNYTLWLRDVFRGYVRDKAVLFTTDGAGSGYLECGHIPGVFSTVDFGAVNNVTEAFAPLRKTQKHGPLVNSEFYPGWLTGWGDLHFGTADTRDVVNTTRQLLSLNASFNFYMFHGGTNFGFSSGANNPNFKPQITSYDYDAPISESGNLTEKYHAIRAVISEFIPVADIPQENFTTSGYGTIVLEPKVSLMDSNIGLKYGEFLRPRTFESVELYSGFMLYETRLPSGYTGRGYLQAEDVHDRAIVFIDRNPIGILSRMEGIYWMIIEGHGGQSLQLLVENQGHINYGNMSDPKGLIGNVSLNGETLTGWNHTGYTLGNVTHIATSPTQEHARLPAFYFGSFQIRGEPQNTFVDMRGWAKGVLFVNGVNLGRYWPEKGPQMSLYLPGTFLSDNNTILILELERSSPNRSLTLLPYPIVPATQAG